MPASFKAPGIIRAHVVHAAQATVAHVSVRLWIDSGAARADAVSHGALAEFIPPVPKFNLFDSVGVFDVSFVVDYEQNLAELVVPDDALAFGFSQPFADNALPIDGIVFDVTKNVTDAVTATDVFTKLITLGLNLADSVTVVDLATVELGGKPELNEGELDTTILN